MKTLIFYSLMFFCGIGHAANVAYIHGDVASDGSIPSGAAAPYDQMLLTDSGNTGLSKFKTLVESQAHTISQHYDATTTLSANFLSAYDVVIFGLHQKLWNSTEKAALDAWLKVGGGMLIYSDSASGGCFCEVGAQNTVGQTTTNNLIAQYGMQVTVDQANGVKQTNATVPSSNIALDGLTLEGEGVSPVAVSNNPAIEVLIPFTENVSKNQNITIVNPSYAALALRTLGDGHIAVMFDRQPMWNNGPGSDIEEEDNQEILRRLINFLAQSPTVTPPITPNPQSGNFNALGAIMLLLD